MEKGEREEKRKEGIEHTHDARTLDKVSSYGDGEKQWIEMIAGLEQTCGEER